MPRTAQLTRLVSLLNDPRYTYEAIGQQLGLSKQRIGQLAVKLRINGRQRERQRTLRRLFSSDGYSSDIRTVIRAIKRLGFGVEPYRCNTCRNWYRDVWKQTVLINGVPCRIYCRRHDRGTTGDGRYVQFHVGRWARQAQAVIFAVWKGRRIKLYVVPVRDLLNVKSLLMPFSGKYVEGGKKPKRDWTAYEDAWNFVKASAIRSTRLLLKDS